MTDKTEQAGIDFPAERKRVFSYTLVDPINRVSDGQRVEKLAIRRPRGLELREVDRITKVDGEVAASWYMIAALTGLSVDDVDGMDAEDVAEVSAIVGGFMPARLTGDKS